MTFSKDHIDKSKGKSFTINGIDFYKGLYSIGSHIASVDDKEIYLSGVLCRTSKKSLKDLARMKIWEITGVYLPKEKEKNYGNKETASIRETVKNS